eukprot:gene3636-biopygen3770
MGPGAGRAKTLPAVDDEMFLARVLVAAQAAQPRAQGDAGKLPARPGTTEVSSARDTGCMHFQTGRRGRTPRSPLRGTARPPRTPRCSTPRGAGCRTNAVAAGARIPCKIHQNLKDPHGGIQAEPRHSRKNSPGGRCFVVPPVLGKRPGRIW